MIWSPKATTCDSLMLCIVGKKGSSSYRASGGSWACPPRCIWNWPITLLGQQVTANRFSLIACSMWTGLSKMPSYPVISDNSTSCKVYFKDGLFDWRDKIARLFHSSVQPSLSILDMPYSWGEWRKKWPLCFCF